VAALTIRTFPAGANTVPRAVNLARVIRIVASLPEAPEISAGPSVIGPSFRFTWPRRGIPSPLLATEQPGR
jgi:hypothetical protein